MRSIELCKGRQARPLLAASNQPQHNRTLANLPMFQRNVYDTYCGTFAARIGKNCATFVFKFVSACVIACFTFLFSPSFPLNGRGKKKMMNPARCCVRPKRRALWCFYININAARARPVKVMLILPLLRGGECSGKVTGSGNKQHLRSHFVSIHLVRLHSGENPVLCGARRVEVIPPV